MGTSTDLVRTDGTSADRRAFRRSCDDRFHNRPGGRKGGKVEPSVGERTATAHKTSLTGQFPPGLQVAVAPQRLEDAAQASFVLHLHLVLAALVDHVAEGAGGHALHALAVAAQERQQLLDPAEEIDLREGTGRAEETNT